MKIKYKIIVGVLVGILIIPQVTFASWWNPLSWNVWKIFRPTSKIEQVQIQKTVQATSTIKTTTTAEETKNSELPKKQIINTNQKTNQQKSQETLKTKESKTPLTAEISKMVVIPTTSIPTNPAAKCLDSQKKWDGFIKSLNDTNKKFSILFSTYNKSAWGTENKPLNVVAQFSYNYERMNPAKAKFSLDANVAEKSIETISEPPLSDTNGIDQIKKNYQNSITALKDAYDLTLAAFKIIADDDDGLSKAEIDTSLALLTDGGDKYDEALLSWKSNDSFLSAYDYHSFKKALNSQNYSNGCVFTFASDNTVITMTTDEEVFTQQNPKSEATANGTTLISIKTKLPIEINDAGQTKTVLKLICNGESRPVTRVDENTIGNFMSKSYTTTRVQCNFVYSGSSKDLFTQTLDFNW
ncbi:MAG: hypothetical protein Athens071416_500 [Parcubacteria group bacterium Athens0714_16]|nr:MAG: hypothetical protein Athens071416_500 [Parcubacteria group bacterium Athens0714_16]